MVLSVGQIQIFLMILARVGGLFIETPVFSARGIPTLAKITIALWLAAAFWFTIPVASTAALPMGLMILFMIKEVLIGFMIGFMCFLLFNGIQGAGDIIDLQMGLSVATTLDPIFGAVVTIIGRLAFMMATLIFLIIDGHHMLIRALHASFTILPLGGSLTFSPSFVFQIIDGGARMWLIAIQLSAPIVLVIFLSDFAFGIVSRVAPQVNVFMLGFQVKPALGLIALMVTLPIFVSHMANLVPEMAQAVSHLLISVRP